MTPMVSQVRTAGSERLPVRTMRRSAAAKKMMARTGKMYFVAMTHLPAFAERD